MAIILLLMCLFMAGFGLSAYTVKLLFWCVYTGTGGKRNFASWWKAWQRIA